jgi:molybdopterin converting factor small subunit
MIEISVHYLGGLRVEKGQAEDRLILPDGSTLIDLKEALASMGLDLDDQELAIVLDGYGLGHYPDNYPLSSRQELAIFPLISGGC